MKPSRTRLALALLAAWTLLAAVPAIARADVGHEVLFHAADDPAPEPTPTPPNDEKWSSQWALEQTSDADIDAQDAWTQTATAPLSQITVAVVDQGVDTTHRDLKDHIVAAHDNDFAPPAESCAGASDHGTAVAGVVGATRDNGLDIAGVASGVNILPVRALNDCGDGTLDSVLAGFKFAAEEPQQANIVVASFATDPWLLPSQQQTIAQRFHEFFDAHPGTLFVVAAGNEGNDNDVHHVYPCNSSETSPNVLCVGASNRDDSTRCTSNFGRDSVDLFAPGMSILSTVRQDTTAQFAGTSMAAPMVAGAAALVEAETAQFTSATIAQTLESSVDPRPWMQGISVAGGRLNAGTATNATTTDTFDPGATPFQGCRDGDGDGVNDATDKCPEWGTGPAGCPDPDGDELLAGVDNCPAVYNPGQADADHDGMGDACDDTPRGVDDDGDGVGALDDHCLTQAGPADNFGCPVPVTATPTPQPPVVTPPPTVTPVVPLRIVSVAATVAHNHKTARLTVRLTRTATAGVTVEWRHKRGHRYVWSRVLRRSFTATAAGRALTVRTSKRGSYRVTVTLAGAKTVRRGFRV